MTADSNKKSKSPCKGSDGRVVEDDGGRRIWAGTIQHVKLSLMKTGVFQFSDQVPAGAETAENPTQSPTVVTDDDPDDAHDDGGFDPYDSAAR